jgi:hypothetical protein
VSVFDGVRSVIATRPGVVASIDTTGGFVEAVKLDDGGVRKLLLRLTRDGVMVEMALPVAQALDFRDEFEEAIAWTAEDR